MPRPLVKDPSRFPPSEVAEFQDAFDLFDEDEDGRLTINELDKALRSCGLIFSESELQYSFQEQDPTNSGIIAFESFLKILAKNLDQPDIAEDMENAFRVFDKQGHEYFTVRELKDILMTYGDPLDPDEMKLFLKDADPKKTGFVIYSEFAQKIGRKLYVRPIRKPKTLRDEIRKEASKMEQEAEKEKADQIQKEIEESYEKPKLITD